MRILSLNPGSSSLKAAVRNAAGGEPERQLLVERVIDIAAAVEHVARDVEQRGLAPDAVAHRVVHGGPHHDEPALIDERLLHDLHDAIPLAPLHLPGALDAIDHARRHWPDVPHVACFDTGFHRTLPDVARRLPIPDELAELGIRRYGFHGLSLQSVLMRHRDLGNVVIAHLGSGCSVTAVDPAGRSRHTTMSFTPTAGMISATRSGDLDPEIALYLLEQHGYPVASVRDLLDKQAGLAGVSGGRRDVRELLDADDPAAQLALELFVRSAAMAVASCATALERWDSLVFTGGIGEHSMVLRERIVARLHAPARLRVEVVPADEELVLDDLTRTLLSRRS